MTLKNNEKIVAASKNSDIKKLAHEAGYKLVTNNGYTVKAICPKCEEKGLAILQTAGITGNYVDLPWVSFKTAFVFKADRGINTDKYTKIYACPCGWRKFVAMNPEKPKCHTKGCNAILPKDRTQFCYKCRPPKLIPVEKALVKCAGIKGKPCGNILPKGRIKYCYTCRPYSGSVKVNQSAKESGSKVTM